MATIVSSKTEQIFLLSALHRFLITLQGEFDCKATEPYLSCQQCLGGTPM